ncbi:GAF sensor signal transduction histidine kinase [Cellulomonas flavigena DSM 20109]|uniref:GAF sensor signal transduction histidine kinase n=1 Tax=Cellulomonas flavigena (strain ATCC 482 / DSM 20109 / BCRC 11376 / JCM 18109 / NBRC 3775 / NCIMB 8073 / NRS 134) TaxID=446466 RepID=D5UGT2_CELFN|nr:GAF domain-containing protein [Cellulomonas flavigena]ADG75180.1 GAF sensor signal transduction histidine kinase [Cellulomonas flavigena DSM 20109]
MTEHRGEMREVAGDTPLRGAPFERGVIRDVPADVTPMTGDALTDLLGAMLAVAGHLELPAVLDQFVRVSAELTCARFAAINVLDDAGTSTTFVYTGVPTAVARAMRHPPHAQGVLGQIPVDGVLRLDDLTEHPSFQGWPAHHPRMGSFLGASVKVGEHVYGQLYLSEKVEGGTFTARDERMVLALAAAAGVAVANAQLYAEAERREHWLRAGQDITTMLLEGVDEESALEHVARTAREVAGADTAALALPGMGGELFIELADGYRAAELTGLVMPRGGRAWTVLEEGRGLLTPSLSASRTVKLDEMRAFGPAMFAPLHSSGRGVGVLVLMRRIGATPFDESDLATAESFAAQAALAYVLAEARHAQDVAALLDERERIARDLHDLAIQQLFATGMQLETVRRRAARGVDPAELMSIVEDALDNVDSSVREIRQIVYALRDPDAATGVVERLRRETSLARTGLGFAPSLVLSLDGEVLTPGDGDAEDRIDERLEQELTDDVVAVVREGLANAARHAHASSVSVRVAVRGAGPTGSVAVDVEDDGAGLPATRERSSGTGNLASRARQHGGTFSLGTAPSGKGTLLTWQAPLG